MNWSEQLLPAWAMIQFYERTIRTKIPWLPSFWGILIWIFPNGFNLLSFQNMFDVVFPVPKSVIPPFEVDYNAIGTGQPLFKVPGAGK